MSDVPSEPPRPAKRSVADYLTDPSARRIEWLALLFLVAFGVFALVITRADLVAQDVPPSAQTDEEPTEPGVAEPVVRGPFTFASLDIHPDRTYASYLSNAFIQSADSSSEDVTLDDFRAQLDIYEKRQGVDDNFSIRVLDNRTAQTLEVFTLREMRDRYEETGEANWDVVDQARRGATNQLVRKWVARGVPKPAVSIRWGRANQVQEARGRDTPTIEYEVRYARQLGLSLLATEIGTVETFNQDWMVSPVGARGRYQMMPDILDLFDVNTYALPAQAGTVDVREELNPLLSLQGSFLLVRGYANAVGHEIPGVSAYHTGPGNIFHLYQTFLRANAGEENLPSKSVTDAYMWGVTDGFTRVRKQSSFGPHSRAYVLQAYGSLRAVEDLEIDPDRTLKTEQVSLRPGVSVTLRDLLGALEPHGGRLDWGPDNDYPNLYSRFRAINQHVKLPVSGSEETVGVPVAGNVTLTRAVDGKRVRFFLPYGASEVLTQIGNDLLDEEAMIRFDEDVFADPARTGEQTQYDRAYERLVQDTGRFGFSTANKRRLDALHTRFQQLAADNPTPYRRAQAKIITIHRRTWGTAAFRELAATVDNVLASRAAPTSAATATTP
ncbi:MAG: hypothetical protein AAGI91_12445 [Bacteroidota bacterium]